MISFAFHPEADEEFVEAVAYYEECEIGLGLDFAREIHAAMQNALDYAAMRRGSSPTSPSAPPY